MENPNNQSQRIDRLRTEKNISVCGSIDWIEDCFNSMDRRQKDSEVQ